MPITSRCCLAFALLAALAACKAETPESAATTADKAPATTDSTAAKVAAVADTLNPLSSPKEELMASVKQFTSLKSYHATMRMSSGAQGEITNEVDFVAPDRFRMKMPMGTPGHHRRHHVHAGGRPHDEGADAARHADPDARSGEHVQGRSQHGGRGTGQRVDRWRVRHASTWSTTPSPSRST
jgi:hypothetical protein